MKYKQQPIKSKQCGQAVMAMVLNKSVLDICNLINNHSSTWQKEIIKLLKDNNINCKYKRCNDFLKIPNDSIIKIEFKGYDVTHWIFKHKGYFYDPDYGIVKKYKSDILPISYMNLTNKI